MSNTLTRTAARIYGTLSGLGGEESTDVLTRLLPFFDPILRPNQGEQFNPDAFAQAVRDTWKWNFNTDVAEFFVPRLVEFGWLTPDDPDIEPITHTITLPQLSEDDPSDATARAELRLLAEDFKAFSESLSPLTAIPRTVEEFEEILIEWLLFIEAFSEKNLDIKVEARADETGKIRQMVHVPRTTTLKSEERFLAARYVAQAIKTNPETGEKLARIAAIGLLTEVVQDFVKPTTPVEASNLIVYLDAPVAMELLGVSGVAARENTQPVVNELQRIGAQVRVFGQSIEEIKRALHAVLTSARPTGPTAQALARGEVLRQFVTQVEADPEEFLDQLGVGVTHRDLDQVPSEHQFFPADYRTEIYGSLIFQPRPSAREHDADVMTLVMRQRGGIEDRDIFRSRFILITRNGLVAQLTARKCKELGVLQPKSIPPVVHRRFLTTSMWLRTGLGNHDLEVPKRHLLANCERVLAIKPGVVDAVKKFTDALDDPEKTRQLDLLIGQHRSTQALMDKTLGTASVVTSENVAELFHEMIHPHLEEERERGEAALKDERQKGRKRVERVKDELAAAKAAEESMQSQLDQKLAEDREAVEAVCEEVEGILAQKRKSRRNLAILLALLLCVPILLEPSSLVTWGTFLVALLLGYLSITGNRIIGTSTPSSSAFDELNKAAERRRVGTKLVQFETAWDGEKFALAQTTTEPAPETKGLI
ncbi:MAG: hypothetical protein QNJ13_17445 [Paracoccaceae bacterium]|nr:hypothetical protein [Paracoccaceae bacterium]